MRTFLAPGLIALALGAVAPLPAAAGTRDYARATISEHAAHRFDQDTWRPRQRIARATINDVEDHDDHEARPKRRYRDDDDDEVRRPSHVKRPPARAGKHAGKHRRAVRRSVRKAPRYVNRPAPRRTRLARLPLRSKVQARPAGAAQHGVASYYWQGQRVASGGWFNPEGMTAAHRTLPFGTRVRITHLRSGRAVDVRINDRGPYIAGRIIDLSRGAARVIGMTGQGIAQVRVTVLGR